MGLSISSNEVKKTQVIMEFQLLCFQGNFEESDEQFRSRGGRNRKYPIVEMLIRKRATPPNQLDGISECFSMFLSQEEPGDP